MNYNGSVPEWHQYTPAQSSEVAPAVQTVSGNHLPYLSGISAGGLNSLNLSSDGLEKHQSEGGGGGGGSDFNTRLYQGQTSARGNLSGNGSLTQMMQMQKCMSHYGGQNNGSLDSSRNVMFGGEDMNYKNPQVAFNGPLSHINGPTGLNGNSGSMGESTGGATMSQGPVALPGHWPSNGMASSGNAAPGSIPGHMHGAVSGMGPTGNVSMGPQTSSVPHARAPPSFFPCKGLCCNPDPGLGYQQWEKYGSNQANIPYRDAVRPVANCYQSENRRFVNNYNFRRENFDSKSRSYSGSSAMMHSYPPMQNYNYSNEYQKYPYAKDYAKDHVKVNGMANTGMLKHQEPNSAQQKYPTKHPQYQASGLMPKVHSSNPNTASVSQNNYYNPQHEYHENAFNRMQPMVQPAGGSRHQIYQQKLAMQRFSMESHLRELSRVPGYQSHPKYKEYVLRYKELLKLQQSSNGYQNTVQQPQRVPTPVNTIPPINLQFDQNGMLLNSTYIPEEFPRIRPPEQPSDKQIRASEKQMMLPTQPENPASFAEAKIAQFSLQKDFNENQLPAKPSNFENPSPEVLPAENVLEQKSSKEFANKPDLDVRQFLANWDETDDEEGVVTTLPDAILNGSTPVVVVSYENIDLGGKESLSVPEVAVEEGIKEQTTVLGDSSCLTVSYATPESLELDKTTRQTVQEEVVKPGSIIHCISNGPDDIPTIHIVDNMGMSNILQTSSEIGNLESQENNPAASLNESSETSAAVGSIQRISEAKSPDGLRKQSSFNSEESHNPDDISLPDLPTSECTPVSTTLNTPTHSDGEESSQHMGDLSISANPIEIMQNSSVISFTNSLNFPQESHFDSEALAEDKDTDKQQRKSSTKKPEPTLTMVGYQLEIVSSKIPDKLMEGDEIGVADANELQDAVQDEIPNKSEEEEPRGEKLEESEAKEKSDVKSAKSSLQEFDGNFRYTKEEILMLREYRKKRERLLSDSNERKIEEVSKNFLSEQDFGIQVTNVNLKIKDGETGNELSKEALEGIKIEINLSCTERKPTKAAVSDKEEKEKKEEVSLKNSSIETRSDSGGSTAQPETFDAPEKVQYLNNKLPGSLQSSRRTSEEDNKKNSISQLFKSAKASANANLKLNTKALDSLSTLDFKLEKLGKESKESWKRARFSRSFLESDVYERDSGYANPIFSSIDELGDLHVVPVYTTKDGKISYSPNRRYTYHRLLLEARERKKSLLGVRRSLRLEGDLHRYNGRLRRVHKKKRRHNVIAHERKKKLEFRTKLRDCEVNQNALFLAHSPVEEEKRIVEVVGEEEESKKIVEVVGEEEEPKGIVEEKKDSANEKPKETNRGDKVEELKTEEIRDANETKELLDGEVEKEEKLVERRKEGEEEEIPKRADEIEENKPKEDDNEDIRKEESSNRKESEDCLPTDTSSADVKDSAEVDPSEIPENFIPEDPMPSPVESGNIAVNTTCDTIATCSLEASEQIEDSRVEKQEPPVDNIITIETINFLDPVPSEAAVGATAINEQAVLADENQEETVVKEENNQSGTCEKDPEASGIYRNISHEDTNNSEVLMSPDNSTVIEPKVPEAENPGAVERDMPLLREYCNSGVWSDDEVESKGLEGDQNPSIEKFNLNDELEDKYQFPANSDEKMNPSPESLTADTRLVPKLVIKMPENYRSESPSNRLESSESQYTSSVHPKIPKMIIKSNRARSATPSIELVGKVEERGSTSELEEKHPKNSSSEKMVPKVTIKRIRTESPIIQEKKSSASSSSGKFKSSETEIVSEGSNSKSKQSQESSASNSSKPDKVRKPKPSRHEEEDEVPTKRAKRSNPEKSTREEMLRSISSKVPKVIIKRSEAGAEFKCELSDEKKRSAINNRKWQPKVKLERLKILDRLAKNPKELKLNLSSLQNLASIFSEDQSRTKEEKKLYRSNSTSNLSPAKRKQRRLSDYNYFEDDGDSSDSTSSFRFHSSKKRRGSPSGKSPEVERSRASCHQEYQVKKEPKSSEETEEIIKIDSSDDSQTTIEILAASPGGESTLCESPFEGKKKSPGFLEDAIPTQLALELELMDNNAIGSLSQANSNQESTLYCSDSLLVKEVLAAKETLKKCLARSKGVEGKKSRPRTAAEKKQGSSFNLSRSKEHFFFRVPDCESASSEANSTTISLKGSRLTSKAECAAGGKSFGILSRTEFRKSPPEVKGLDHSNDVRKESKGKEDNMPVLEPEVSVNFDLSNDRDSSRSPPVITRQECDEQAKILDSKGAKTEGGDDQQKICADVDREMTIADIITQLAYHEKATIKHRRYCNLCERWFPTTSRHKRHLSGYQHRHVELMQRKSIHALFVLFTGKPCPKLPAANIVRTDCSIGELTPLQIAVQDVAKTVDYTQKSPKVKER